MQAGSAAAAAQTQAFETKVTILTTWYRIPTGQISGRSAGKKGVLAGVLAEVLARHFQRKWRNKTFASTPVDTHFFASTPANTSLKFTWFWILYQVGRIVKLRLAALFLTFDLCVIPMDVQNLDDCDYHQARHTHLQILPCVGQLFLENTGKRPQTQ